MARLHLPDIEKPDKQKPFSAPQIEHALMEMGVDYTRGPKEAYTHCIFHNDTGKANLYINLLLKPGVYHCFACEARGTFDEFVRVKTGWTLMKTLQYLNQLRKVVTFEEEPTRKLAVPITEVELDKYKFRHPYCFERGLSEATLQRYDIGYDREDESLTIPWYDTNKKLVTIKRRSVLTKRYTYPENVDLRGVLFGMQFLKMERYVWITEGEFDAMYLDQAHRTGHFDDHVDLALGGKVLHDAAIAALCKRQPKAVILALDMDDYGRQACIELHKRLIEYVPVFVPEYSTKDPNELNYTEIVSLTHSIEKRAA